jgi:hypothetical protein
MIRALRFNRPPPLQKPVISHPLDRLTCYKGTIYEMYQEHPVSEYMPFHSVEVTGKLSLKELANEQCEYRFRLNWELNPIWRSYFKALIRGLTVHFEGAVMGLICFPADLETSYQRVKQAIAQANDWYAVERAALILKVIAKDQERQAAKEMEENRRMGLHRQFGNLEL